MKNTHNHYVMRVSVIAVRGALAALVAMPAAFAADAVNEEVLALTQPTKSIEVGVGYVNKDSFKFGEYNGLNKSGPYAIGGLDMRGGGSYDSDDAYRWSILARDLGLNTRYLNVETGNQGKFRLNYSYDQQDRNYSDSFQTFYNGAGTNAMTLPASFAATTAAQRLSANTTTPTGALSNWANIQSPYATAACATTGGVPTAACRGPGYLIPAAMHNFNVDTMRTRQNLGLDVILAPGWNANVSVTHDTRDGNKLTGVAFGGPARGVMGVEPINSSTNQLKASLGYVDEKAHFNVGYYGSFYRNDTNLWTVENPYQGNLLAASFKNTAMMSGMPDNEMHRFSLTGGYNFTNATRFVVAGNYSRMTQNEAYLTGLPANWVVPVTSANAKVISKSFTASLTDRSFKDWNLGAVYKYENRDNQTPIHSYLVQGGDAATAPIQFTNEPLNRRMQQVSLDANYALARRQSLKFGFDTQEINRTADGPDTPFRVERNRENTWRVDYRNNVSQNVTGNIGYSHSRRRGSEYEENTLLPVPTVAPLPAADPLLVGFRQFYLADRDRDQLRSSVNFQVSDAASIQAGIDYNKDNYANSPYGLKNSRSLVYKLDGSYASSEKLSFNAFYTYEDKKSQLDSLTIGRGSSATILDAAAHVPGSSCTGYFVAGGHLPADEGTDTCRQWTVNQADKVHTIGFGAKANKFLIEKFDLSFDVAYARSRTPIDVTGGAYFGNGNPATTAAAATASGQPFNNIFIAAQSFPDITTNMLDLRWNGVYKIDKSASVRVNYIFRRLRTADWQYDSYTNSTLGSIAIPTYPGVGITAPNYAVQAFGMSYIYTFN